MNKVYNSQNEIASKMRDFVKPFLKCYIEIFFKCYIIHIIFIILLIGKSLIIGSNNSSYLL